MSKIEEVTLISDDEDEHPMPKKIANGHSDGSVTPISSQQKLVGTFAILKETLLKPTLNSTKDEDSDCEITEVPINGNHKEPAKVNGKPVKTPEPTPSTSKRSVNADSDEEITEIVVINKSNKTTDADKLFDTVRDSTTSNHVGKKVKVEVPVKSKDKVVGDKEKKEIDSSENESKPSNVVKPEPSTSQVQGGRRTKCCNSDCAIYGYNFQIAPSFIKAYYGVNENKPQVYTVCPKCTIKSEEYFEALQKLVEEKKPLINAAKMVPKRDTVVLEDSDEEEIENDKVKLEDPSDEMFEVDLGDLQAVLEATWADLAINEQVDMCEQEVENHTKNLQLDMEELDQGLSNLQLQIDSMRKRLYEPWNPNYQELPSMEIVDIQGKVERDEPQQQLPVATKSTTPNRTPRVVAMKKVTQVQKNYRSADQSEILDLGKVDHRPHEPLPPMAPLERPPPVVGQVVYAMKSTLFMEWLKARVIEISKTEKGETMYKVKFAKASAPLKWLPAKQLAYCESPKVQLVVGTRIIAVFHNSEEDTNDYDECNKDSKDHYYAGIIAEQLKTINRHRYLVFFDDGFTQYVPHSKVCAVIGQSRCVWEDCHEDCQDFTRTYVTQFPERPMVKLQVGQVVKTEWNTRWWLARVRKVDCSLVLVHFDADGRTEWIYRGSTRLGPLYSEMAKKTERQKKGLANRAYRSLGTSHKTANQPFVEYTRGESVDENTEERRNLNRSVAKKSTGGRQVEGIFHPPVDRKENVGHVQNIKDCGFGEPPKFKPHQCKSPCIGKETFREGSRVLQNPMLIPLQNGWVREVYRFKDRASTKTYKTHSVFYVAPCGRRLRTMQEVHRYLRLTKSYLGVDLFCFDPQVQLNTEFVVPNPLFQIKDISYDKENVVIPCVNTINHHEYPAYVEYATKRIPTEGVEINDDPGFLVCCDCTDGCKNKSKCACHQLTVEVAKDKSVDPEKLGYSYRRLIGGRNSAIYECNKMCKCNASCLNRVVQHPMKVQLQLFKTEKRGWGIRALNDLAPGTFLCIYAGQLLTELEANEEGKTYGDEYLAELDYIEVTERDKEDYESDITDIEDSDSDTELESKYSEDSQDLANKKRDADTDFTVDNGVTAALGEPSRSMTLRQRNEKLKKKEAEDNNEDEEDKKTGEVRAPRSAPDNPAKQSVRYMFDQTEDIYVMDAKGIGNIGRYFNHSCDPNVIVQNVFVDTHDLRYPWVAFFTSKFCRAGTELCWNYNYEIDSLPGRRLDCYCESFNCKGRLL